MPVCVDRTKFITYATSLGGVETLVDWRRLYDESISPLDLRLSVGLEDLDDLTSDINNALGLLV